MLEGLTRKESGRVVPKYRRTDAGAGAIVEFVPPHKETLEEFLARGGKITRVDQENYEKTKLQSKKDYLEIMPTYIRHAAWKDDPELRKY